VNQVGQMGDRVVAAYHGVTSRIGSGNNNDLEVGAGGDHEGVGDSAAGAAISALGEPSGLAGRIGSDLHPPKKKRYYNLPFMMGKVSLKIGFDRLALLALLDRSATFLENSASVILSVGVAAMTGLLLNQNHYQDLSTFLVCGVAAGCQYSLLKSVQPDSASPTHGFNRITVFSRAVYFVLCSALCLLMSHLCDAHYENSVKLYQTTFPSRRHLELARDGTYTFILFFPIIFVLGLLPQVNTFLMYVFEQIDIHVFGGNATSSLSSSCYCLCRSLLASLILFGFAYGGLTEGRAHSEETQRILFSIFCALSLAISYHLSRCSSDPTVILSMIKNQLLQDFESASGEMVGDSVERGRPSDKPNQLSGQQEGATGGGKGCQGSGGVPGGPAESPTDSTSSSSFPEDPLPAKLMETVYIRLKSDAITCTVIAVLTFFIHWSGFFGPKLQPNLSFALWIVAALLGPLLHYVLPQMRKELPWLCFSHPVFKANDYDHFEAKGPTKVMWFERLSLWAQIFEKNVLYPLIFLSALTVDIERIKQLPSDGGHWIGTIILVVTALKTFRSSFSDCSKQYLILIFTILLFQFDSVVPGGDWKFFGEVKNRPNAEPFIISYFITSFLFHKCHEAVLKWQFVITYIAPWQIPWGSAFHAFAQPFIVPHSAMLFLQAAISSIFSTPLNPLLGSAIFVTSYVRPVKFWERDYNTKRVDHSNTRLATHLDRNPGADDNNLNSIFYEHLTRSLQHSLSGDILLGRWGNVSQGDCFVLASCYLNCLVHVIEVANGVVTFQVRGLEFRGTYCQQREVEAINEGVDEDLGCCCFEPGHLPNMLSMNAAFSQRWLAWEVTAKKYVLEGYSITDNSAQNILEVYDLRKVLVSYYVKSIIYYTARSPKLDEWLLNPAIIEALIPCRDKNFVDLDPLFNMHFDQDYDFRATGITRKSFLDAYGEWISHCVERRSGAQPPSSSTPPRDSNGLGGAKYKNDTEIHQNLISLCFALSLLGRRALGAASASSVYLPSVEFFLHGLHALFKGDFRITSVRDEWVFSDMELLRKVVAPGVRMSVKLNQDHFISPDEYDDPAALYDAISQHEKDLVISHEGDPAWRSAVLSGADSLLALRHVVDDGGDDYKIIMLNKRHISFRVIKLNRECVRGLWAGQQQELIFLRNRNPERGSIQNAKQALRNIINSSCDQPIGYPIYVSPLTTSFVDTNPQVASVIGEPLTLSGLKAALFQCWSKLWKGCESCSTGSSTSNDCGVGGSGPVNQATATASAERASANSGSAGATGPAPNDASFCIPMQPMGPSHSQSPPMMSSTPPVPSLQPGQRARSNGPPPLQQQHSVETSDGLTDSKGGIGASSGPGTKGTHRGGSLPAYTLPPVSGYGGTKNPRAASLGSPMGSSAAAAALAAMTSTASSGHTDPLRNMSSFEPLGLHVPPTGATDGVLQSTTTGQHQPLSDKHHVSSSNKSELKNPPQQEGYYRARINDPNQVYDKINLGRRIDPIWPDETWRFKGGRDYWKNWVPDESMEGIVVHKWLPCHREAVKRSHVDRTIVLLKIGERYVPVVESAVDYILTPVSSANENTTVLACDEAQPPPATSTKTEAQSVSEVSQTTETGIRSVTNTPSNTPPRTGIRSVTSTPPLRLRPDLTPNADEKEGSEK